jgi:hypothetical protein
VNISKLVVSLRIPALVATGGFLAAMKGLFATRIFRIVFVLAGCYNLAFGLWAGFYPLHFFEIFDLPPPLYPAIWSCLGMVVGVYGLLYWYAAWKLDNARPIITVGLLGKVLGPVGMALNISQQWPARLGMLCVYNDVIWWRRFRCFCFAAHRSPAVWQIGLHFSAPQFTRWECWQFYSFCARAFKRSPTLFSVQPTSPSIRLCGRLAW